MVIHIAICKWKERTKAEDVEKLTAAVRALKDKVDGILDIRCGENFSRWNEGYTHAFLVLARDRDAYDAYVRHPDHRRIAERILAMGGKSIGIDFED